ncbi:MAG TPA: ABC transporter ATP-binding protein [Chloroflexota bacterium]|nr:ABC transporter ATP-binding protein [Chloroflexota bacterium]
MSFRAILWRYLVPQRRRVTFLVLLLAASIGLQLANPQILRAFIDRTTSGGELSVLLQLAGLFVVVAVLNQGAAVAEVAVAENVGLTATNELRADLTQHCLELDLAFHRARTAGELIERVDGDVANLSNFFARFVVQIVGNGILVVAVLALLFAVHPWVGAATTLLAVIAMLVLYGVRNVGAGPWERARAASADLFGFLEERLAGTEDIRSSGAVDYVLRRLAERHRALLRTQLLAMVIGITAGNLGNLLLTLTTVVGLGIGAVLFRGGALTIGAVYLIYAYTRLLSRPIEQLSRQLQDLQKASASLERIRHLFALRPTLVGGRLRLPAGPLAVDLDRVSFAYDDGEPVLRQVEVLIEPGEVVGLLGRTGSGKTSLARLVARLYDPTDGAVRVGGINLRETSLADLRRAIGVVTQDVQIFRASVRDNLTLFDATISDDAIRTVLETLGLEEWARALPAGMASVLGTGAVGISAGEAQLLAFARVFLRNPGLVILDEASSRVDPATERRIESALDRLLVGRTAIIIAHRLATVERADRIVILDDGAVVEAGRRADLAADPTSRFARLLRVGLAEALA